MVSGDCATAFQPGQQERNSVSKKKKKVNIIKNFKLNCYLSTVNYSIAMLSFLPIPLPGEKIYLAQAKYEDAIPCLVSAGSCI